MLANATMSNSLRYLIPGFLPFAFGCGDCVSLGYPAIELTVVELANAAPVPLGSAVLSFATSTQSDPVPPEDTRFLGSANTYRRCCVRGAVRIHLQQNGFVAWDSTVTVHTSGGCEIPDLERITVRLRRA